MILKSSVLILFFLVAVIAAKAQLNTQTIKGTIVDIESGTPLPGATVILLSTTPPAGSSTDTAGNFRIDNVKVGRYTLQISYIGFETVLIPEILVTSGKEVVINAGMKQSMRQMNAVTIEGSSEKDRPMNTMSSVSARSFTVEETRRYAGGLDDPARLASSFAGVAMSSISDNGIVIRGNSAKGVAWRLEGVDIPNPNHFAGADVAGGGIVTIFSSQMLANSDFYTGAFPAEYGNAMAGVFDMKFRNGNNEKREYTLQAGVMGFDLASEGPFRKGHRSSYLFNYRYSTFGLIKVLMPKHLGIPDYQDLSFKLNFPNQHGATTLWGIGSIDNLPRPPISDSSKWETNYDRIYFNWKQRMGAFGITNKYLFGKQTYLSTTLAGNGTINKMDAKRFDDESVARQNWLFTDNSFKLILSSYINHKVNERLALRSGFYFNTLFFNLDLNGTVNDNPSTFRNFVKQNGNGKYLEYYAESKYDITRNLTLFTGVNSMYLMLNKNFSLDPRISVKWEFQPGQSLSLGFGKHSQLEELKIYFISNTLDVKTVYPNKELGLSHSLQFVTAYDWHVNSKLRLKVEPYFQYLYNIPGIPGSSWSMINFTQDWSFRDSLSNNSQGRNFGIDITMERFLSNNYYWLVTASVFESKYRADDGIWRNTRFNKGYVVNLLAGKEYFLKNNNMLGINIRLNLMGGERISPVMEAESLIAKEVIYDQANAFQHQMPATCNLDFTVTYRTNKKRLSGVWALQLKNALASPMNTGYDYYYKTGTIHTSKETIILPILSYKIEF